VYAYSGETLVKTSNLGLSTSTYITGLAYDITHTFNAVAVNEIGSSDKSSSVSGTPQSIIIELPEDFF
jgi:hypothetical protein